MAVRGGVLRCHHGRAKFIFWGGKECLLSKVMAPYEYFLLYESVRCMNGLQGLGVTILQSNWTFRGDIFLSSLLFYAFCGRVLDPCPFSFDWPSHRELYSIRAVALQ